MHIRPREFAGNFFCVFQLLQQNPRWPPKSYVTLELELLHGFVSCLVQRNNPTLDVCWLVFCVITILKTYICLLFRISVYFSVLLILANYQNFVILLYNCMLSSPEKKVRRIVSLFSFFQQNSRWLTNMLLWRAWTASQICSKESTDPGHMLIRFWCDSEITFSRGLHKNLVTVLYFSIINVLCGAGGDASFALQANLEYLLSFWKIIPSHHFLVDNFNLHIEWKNIFKN